MASKLFFSSLTIFFILSSSILSPSSADVPPASPVSTGSLCRNTLYPSFCRSVLPTNNNSANVYDYGRFSVRKSMSYAQKFLALIDNYLRHSSLTPSAIAALEDCRFLALLNLDFLASSFQTVSTNSSVLPSLEAEDVQTFLSAIITNVQTCLDGLRDAASAWSVKNGLAIPLANNTKLYSVSLALFNKGWVPKKTKGTSTPGKKPIAFKTGRHGQLPLKMSKRHQAIYESVSRRKNLETNGDGLIPVSDIVVVSQDGSFNFTTINDALNAAPINSNGSNGYFLIYVTAGVYQEYVSIAKSQTYLLMIGDGINQTVITGNRSVVDGWTTFNSSTFSVVGKEFVAVGITFQNTAGAIKQQAVAVRNDADLSTFYQCSFEAYQDTLYAHSLRQFYRECDIYGTIDFIFGNAAAVFQNCNIYARLPLIGQFNVLTAQGRTDPNQNTGTSIQNCTITASAELASSNTTFQTFLGRPWKQYSRTVYMESFLDSLIDPSGWHEWNGDFGLNTSYYAEFNNSGPGSDTSERVTWPGYHIINATDASNFTVSNFLLGDNWLPQTGVPYSDGL